MLEELSVRSFVLIDQARIPFKPGLNVLTGETGAGKSILVGALGLLLGAKGENGFIRSGAEEAHLSAVISLPEEAKELKSWMEENGLAAEDGLLILRRVLRQTNRSSCYLGSSPLTRQQLEDLTGHLVDLHGQHEHQSLFSPEAHRRAVDQFLGLESEIRDFSLEYGKLSQIRQSYEDFCAQAERREEELFRLKNLVSDISRASLRPGEEEELTARRKRMNQHEKLYSSLSTMSALLWDGRSAALGQLKQGLLVLDSLAALDPKLAQSSQTLESLYLELEDALSGLHSYHLGLNFSPEELQEVEDRLSQIYALEKKYAPTVEALIRLEAESREKLASLESSEDTKALLAEKVRAQEKLVLQKASELTQKRKQGAQKLSVEIADALKGLGMGKARFDISVSPRSGDGSKAVVGPSGADAVEFLISPNPGEPLKSLREIASGGEISRVMLALKSVLADADNVPILVFDEIDSGIGGEIGRALGRYLKKTARKKQVICITHLASIAAFADHHLRIEKSDDGGRTTTRIEVLETDDKVREIARMLSGNVSDASLQHARELMAGSKDDLEV